MKSAKHISRPLISWQCEYCSWNWFWIQTFTGKG